jgi:hypothetical protein
MPSESDACPMKVSATQVKGFHSVDSLSTKREIQFDRFGVATAFRPMVCDASKPATSPYCQMNANLLGHALALTDQYHSRMSTKCGATR